MWQQNYSVKAQLDRASCLLRGGLSCSRKITVKPSPMGLPEVRNKSGGGSRENGRPMKSYLCDMFTFPPHLILHYRPGLYNSKRLSLVGMWCCHNASKGLETVQCERPSGLRPLEWSQEKVPWKNIHRGKRWKKPQEGPQKKDLSPRMDRPADQRCVVDGILDIMPHSPLNTRLNFTDQVLLHFEPNLNCSDLIRCWNNINIGDKCFILPIPLEWSYQVYSSPFPTAVQIESGTS